MFVSKKFKKNFENFFKKFKKRNSPHVFLRFHIIHNFKGLSSFYIYIISNIYPIK